MYAIRSYYGNGKNECNTKPVLVEANAQDKYQDYFFTFFADGGKYADFVSMKDESLIPKIAKDYKFAGSEVTYGVIVRVKRQELRQQLIADGIIKTN